MSITIDLPADIDQRLDRLAAETGLTKASFYPELVRNGIDDLEDYHRAALALARYRRGEEAPLGEDEVRRQLGLDG